MINCQNRRTSYAGPHINSNAKLCRRSFYHLFIFFFTFFHNACSRQDIPECSGSTQKIEISLGGAKVEYTLDSNFIYKYEFFENMGPLESKNYILEEDTLHLSWYRNKRGFNDSIGIVVIKDFLDSEGYYVSSSSFEHMDFNDLEGVFLEYKEKDKSTMIFYGLNKSTNLVLWAEYDLSNNRNSLFCVLNSMRFKKNSELLQKE